MPVACLDIIERANLACHGISSLSFTAYLRHFLWIASDGILSDDIHKPARFLTVRGVHAIFALSVQATSLHISLDLVNLVLMRLSAVAAIGIRG